MQINAIVARSRNHAIGKDGDIPWYLPADLKYFKKQTLNRHIIMGRKTFESIGRPLPKRTNIVVTRNPFYVASNCLVVGSVQEALQLAAQNGEEQAWIIGGGEIYRLTEPYWDKLYLTEVELEVEDADAFFEFKEEDFMETSCETHPTDEKNEYGHTFRVLKRKSDR